MIPVTKPFLPPKGEYEAYLSEIWERNWLTNDGPIVKSLEEKLKDYLGLSHLLFVSNGTVALQFAIKALRLEGEIITTPFSYVATTSSIVWEGCTPVFVDVNPNSFNIDPLKIEAAITSKTSAILATHVYGNPCDIDAIQEIADKYDLKVIYDAAHCFGTKYKGDSVFRFGDVSTTSFHATKLFHTIEGGAVFANDENVVSRMSYMRNFGHDGPERFKGVGINGKNSEFHAAMGLVNLNYIEQVLNKRKLDSIYYNELLACLDLGQPKINEDSVFNYAYYPVVFSSEEQCLKVLHHLAINKVGARRYFYPLLSSLDYVSSKDMPLARIISSRVLCLPLYQDLKKQEIEMICSIIIDTLRSSK